jgi:hypothetical protein
MPIDSRETEQFRKSRAAGMWIRWSTKRENASNGVESRLHNLSELNHSRLDPTSDTLPYSAYFSNPTKRCGVLFMTFDISHL